MMVSYEQYVTWVSDFSVLSGNNWSNATVSAISKNLFKNPNVYNPSIIATVSITGRELHLFIQQRITKQKKKRNLPSWF